jgi:hypothetical protein
MVMEGKGQKGTFNRTAILLLSFLLVFILAPSSLWIKTSAAAATTSQPRRLIVAWDSTYCSQATGAPAPSLDPGDGESLAPVLQAWPGLEENLASAPAIAPNTQALQLPDTLSTERAQELIRTLPGVRMVEPDVPAGIDVVSSDPLYGQQWFLPHVGAEEAWGLELGSRDLIVAVVDTGVDASHPDLAGRVLEGYDFVNRDATTADDHGHGTHVAGIIAASGEDGVGVAGMAWRVRVLPVKVLDAKGSGYYSDIIAGIRYAADRGAAVINLSLSGGASSAILQEAVDYARSRGSLVVAAAGNDALDSLGYPAACRGVTSVGAVDENDIPASFSNRGEGLDLVAPGLDIYSDFKGRGFASMSGTSMAAPQVAGAAALLRSLHPDWGIDQVEQRLSSTARDLGDTGYDLYSGWGLLQADRALGYTEPAALSGGSLYFAEGCTGPGFDTYALLENPGGDVARAALCFYSPQGPSSILDVDIPPRSRLTLHLNQLVPAGDVSTRVTLPEGSPVRVQRSMYFNYGDIGGGHTSFPVSPSGTWYFAEGYTGPGYDTYLLLFNPQTEAAQAVVDWMTPDGASARSLTVPALSRRTVRINDYLPDSEVATSLNADRPIVAERAMYFDSAGRTGGSDSVGAAAPAREWYFAEGYTGGGFDEWLLLLNPGDTEVHGQVSFLRSDGLEVEQDLLMQPRSRATIHVDEVAGLEDAEVSATVKVSSPGVVVERAMYFATQIASGKVDGGHVALGTASPGDHWLLPEGYTGDGFESWILVVNLEDREVDVHVSLFGENGEVVERDYKVKPHARFTIRENDLMPGQGVSAEISAPAGTRLVVEGAYYFRLPAGIDDGNC